ncbi:DUF5076 domain-containing protein [Microbulbifer sp. SSSA007]|uniref:DUF5076 domain-containing protein n=1 Tax=Microbulbifer sp. SSSA007 TaxID=3243379 RepID=UPI00403A6547
MNELEIPPAAVQDENSVELIRAFVANGAQWTSINPHLFRNHEFQEEKAWGIFLADTIKHLASAISESKKVDGYDVIVDIVEALNNELDLSTSDVQGGYLKE